jgi:hypothetical protein
MSLFNKPTFYFRYLEEKNPGKHVEDVKWIVATDATPTNGRLGLLEVNDLRYLVGHDHKPGSYTQVNVHNNCHTDVFALEDGTINGIEGIPKMKSLDLIKASTQISTFVLVPLTENSWPEHMLYVLILSLSYNSKN